MTQFQQIAKGLLGFTHPEIFMLAGRDENTPEGSKSSAAEEELTPARDEGRHDDHQRYAGALVRGFKFAFAALVAGSRTVPLGDNKQLTRELGAYGARLDLDSRCNS